MMEERYHCQHCPLMIIVDDDLSIFRNGNQRSFQLAAGTMPLDNH